MLEQGKPATLSAATKAQAPGTQCTRKPLGPQREQIKNKICTTCASVALLLSSLTKRHERSFDS